MKHEEEVERIMLDAIRVRTDARNLAFPYLQEGIEKMKVLVASAEKNGREETISKLFQWLGFSPEKIKDFMDNRTAPIYPLSSLWTNDKVWFEVDKSWNEAIEAARKVAEEHKSTDGECPESIANAEGYRTAVSQIAESINKLKRG